MADETKDTTAQEAEAPQDGRSFLVEGNDISGYVGVSPEYMNYASETHAPLENDDEKAARKERERKTRVVNGDEAPKADDVVLFEGQSMTYAEAKKAAGRENADKVVVPGSAASVTAPLGTASVTTTSKTEDKK